ncbi:hypothetical protein D3C72_2203210 [compost metagenome]
MAGVGIKIPVQLHQGGEARLGGLLQGNLVLQMLFDVLNHFFEAVRLVHMLPP